MSDGHRPTETVREPGCWSHNAADGYSMAINRCIGHLEDAAHHLKQLRIDFAQKDMKEANAYMNEANVWFNQANNERFRIEALVAEVKALRSGVGVTYAEGNDPTNDNWKVPT